MRATHQLKYAIYGVFDLAYHGARRPIRIQEIGDRQGIPARYLEQIFQRLRRAGLVISKRGPGGGYQLGRPATEITIADIVAAVQGAVLLRPECQGEGSGSPDFVWELLDAGIEQALGAASVADLCVAAAERGIPREEAEPVMYQI